MKNPVYSSDIVTWNEKLLKLKQTVLSFARNPLILPGGVPPPTDKQVSSSMFSACKDAESFAAGLTMYVDYLADQNIHYKQYATMTFFNSIIL